MVECSLCSLLSFIFRCITNVISAAFDYPLEIFLLSLLLALVLFSNVYTAKLISDFSNVALCDFMSQENSTNVSNGISNNFDYGAERGELAELF